MIDKITIERIKEIHPSLFVELNAIYHKILEVLTGKAYCRFVQVYRDIDYQNQLYAQGRTKPGSIVTQAKGGQSYHNYGLAVDFCLVIDENNDGKIQSNEIKWERTKDYDGDLVSDWMEVVKIFQSYGWKWGAPFNDYPHFEKTPFNWRELLKRYNEKKFVVNDLNNLKYVKLGK